MNSEKQDIYDKFSYKHLIKNRPKTRCSNFAINYESTLLLGINRTFIYFFGLFSCQRQIRQINKLIECTQVEKLFFMNNSDSFVTQCYYNELAIWEYNEQKILCKIKQFKAHNSTISSILFNSNNDLIITASFDQTIKFWGRKSQWNCLQVIQIFEDVHNLIMNENEDKLIFLSYNLCESEYLTVMELKANYQYQRKQKIPVLSGFKLFKASNNMFILSKQFYCEIDLFDLTDDGQTINFIRKVKTSQGGHVLNLYVQFIKQKNQIFIGRDKELVSMSLNNSNLLLTTVQFFEKYYQKMFSDDGRFLILWVRDYDEVNIRRLIIK